MFQTDICSIQGQGFIMSVQSNFPIIILIKLFSFAWQYIYRIKNKCPPKKNYHIVTILHHLLPWLQMNEENFHHFFWSLINHIIFVVLYCCICDTIVWISYLFMQKGTVLIQIDIGRQNMLKDIDKFHYAISMIGMCLKCSLNVHYLYTITYQQQPC